MSRSVEACARELLETIPPVMRFIRDQVRQGHAGGLALSQYRTLNFVRRVRQPSLTAAAASLGLSLPAMSRLAGGLVKRGLIERRPVATNRRRIALSMTVRGEAALEAARAAIRGRLAGALHGLPDGELEAMRRAFPALRHAFGTPAAGRKGGSGR